MVTEQATPLHLPGETPRPAVDRGGCRASNYIHLLRKALKKAGMGQIPVISLSASGMEPNPGFKLTPTMIDRIFYAIQGFPV